MVQQRYHLITHFSAFLLACAVASIVKTSAFVPSQQVGNVLRHEIIALHKRDFVLFQSLNRGQATSTSQRKAKQKRKKKMRKRGASVLSESDLQHHVATQYIYGPGGKLKDVKARAAKHRKWKNDQAENLRKLDGHPALLLNADYQPASYLPLSIWSWQEAVKAVFCGKVTVVDVYPDVTIRAASLEIPLPSVIALNEYIPQPKNTPAFTKRNVFLRDEYRCQYCADRFHTRDLSLDHVVPRCRGGRLNWYALFWQQCIVVILLISSHRENAVTCCRACNGRKGSLSLQQLRGMGMKLVREPFVPTQYQLHSIAGRMLPRRVHPSWAPFLGMEKLEGIKSVEPWEVDTYAE